MSIVGGVTELDELRSHHVGLIRIHFDRSSEALSFITELSEVLDGTIIGEIPTIFALGERVGVVGLIFQSTCQVDDVIRIRVGGRGSHESRQDGKRGYEQSSQFHLDSP